MKYRYVFSLLLVFVFFNSSYLVNAMDSEDDVNASVSDDQFAKLKKWMQENIKPQVVNNHFSTQVGDGAFVLPQTPAIAQAFNEYLNSEHSWMTYLKKGASQGFAETVARALGPPIAAGIMNGFILVKKSICNTIYGPTIEEQLNNYAQEGAAFNTEAMVFAQVYNQMPPDKRLEKMKNHMYTMMEKRLGELDDIVSSKHKKVKPISDEFPQQEFNKQLAEEQLAEKRKQQENSPKDIEDVDDDEYDELLAKLEAHNAAGSQG